MTVAGDTSAEARRIQLDVLRRLGGPARLEMACRMSDDARAISEAGVRHRHPDWTDEQVHRSILELLLGSDLARKTLSEPATSA